MQSACDVLAHNCILDMYVHSTILCIEAHVACSSCSSFYYVFVVISQALDEINAGRMDGLTYEYVAEHMADEYEARRLDKV
jgi:broad specificity phosphatase PhoE